MCAHKLGAHTKVWEDVNMNPVSLEGKKGLVVGIANEYSLAYGCASRFRGLGADLAITYREESERWVRHWRRNSRAQLFCRVTCKTLVN